MSFQIDLDRFCQTLAREAPDAIIYADAEGFIRFWNRGAERIFRFEEAEAIGKSLDIVIPENLRKRHWDGYAETMRSGKTRYGAGDILSGAGAPQGWDARFDRVHHRPVPRWGRSHGRDCGNPARCHQAI